MRGRTIWTVSSAILVIMWALASHPAEALETRSEEPIPFAGRGLLIEEFYPCAVCGDEYFALLNSGASAVPLEGWMLTDGEGSLLFTNCSPVVPSGRVVVVSENGSSFLAAFGSPADVRVPGWEETLEVSVIGGFRLADAGDSLTLIAPDGSAMDTVMYGETSDEPESWVGDPIPGIRRGEVVKRTAVEGRPIDTDSAADWEPFREYRYGYTCHMKITSEVGPGDLMAFVSPDCSLSVVLSEIESSSISIRACAYEISSGPFCSALVNASARGVEVRILVEGSPVGGMSDSQIKCLSVLAREGVQVLIVRGSLDMDVVRHIGILHSKYIVVDDSRIVIMSENFVEDGLPADELCGNRGWGICVTDRHLSSYLASVFDEDSRLDRPDVLDWRVSPLYNPHADLSQTKLAHSFQGQMTPLVSSTSAQLELLVSPDVNIAGPFLGDMISGSDEVFAQVFQADLWWQTRWSSDSIVSPIVDSLGCVLASGGSIRLLLDPTWYNMDRNGELIGFLDDMECTTAECAQFCLMPAGGPVTSLHNKGLVLDGLRTVVSSNNWVCASFSRNRELAAVVTSAEIAGYFTEVFEVDWYPDIIAPVADPGPDLVLRLGEEALLDGSASFDDRAISNMSWDIDGDGWADSYGITCPFSARTPGDYMITLTVIDSWGNSAIASVNICVVGDENASAERPAQASSALLWTLPVISASAYVLIRLLRSRKD